jgi:hypothetical protein
MAPPLIQDSQAGPLFFQIISREFDRPVGLDRHCGPKDRRIREARLDIARVPPSLAA